MRKYDYIIESYDDREYVFEQCHKRIVIEAKDDKDALEKASDLKPEGHYLYQILTKNGFDKTNCAQPIWDFFNGFLR